MEALHLPWTNEALRTLLLQIVETGETTKVDFKRQLSIDDAAQQGELLKDISALANTYDYSYQNHGLMLIGVEQEKIICCDFSQNVDGLQARIDELIKHYIDPFVPTQVRIFDHANGKWGVVVVPPTRNAPHVFVKDIHKKHRGDIYVRRGTVTDKASPTDYARFFRQHIEEHTYDLKQQISALQRDVDELQRLARRRSTRPKSERAQIEEVPPPTQLPAIDLLVDIDRAFASVTDSIDDGLIKEVRRIRELLDSDAIPWGMGATAEIEPAKVLRLLEDTCRKFWRALTKIVERDDSGEYEDTIVRALAYLARSADPPIGITFTNLGCAIRYYPIVMSLYLVFVIGCFKKRTSLLKKIKMLKLARRSHFDAPRPIPNVLFYIRNADGIFRTQHPNFPGQTWLDPIAGYLKTVFDREINLADPFWDRDSAFFVGEFVLCLTALDIVDPDSDKPTVDHVPSGGFLFYSSAIPSIKRLLNDDRDWLATIFQHSLKEILLAFDATAQRVSHSYGSWGGGFDSGATDAAYPEKKRTETK